MERTWDLPALPPRRRALLHACLEQADNPNGPGNDPIFALMAEAMAHHILEGELGDVLDQCEDFREKTLQKEPRDHHQIMQLCRRNLQDKFLRMYPNDYPLNIDSVEKFIQAIDEVLTDPSVRHDFETHQAMEDVRSNVVPRYGILHLLGHVLKERTGENPSYLDVGCSANLGLTALANNYKFDKVEVMASSSNGLEVDQDQTDAANILLASRLAIGASVGVDLFPLNFDSISWVRSCSFYPTELLKPALVMRFDDLAQDKPRRIGFQQGDFSKEEQMGTLPVTFAQTKWEATRPRNEHTTDSLRELAEFIGQSHQERELFDFVTFVTSMYLMNQSQRLQALDLAKRLVKKSGFVLLVDFAEKRRISRGNSRTGLYFHNNFQYAPYPYRVYAIPGNSRTGEPVHIMSGENGRARRLKLEPGRLSINGSKRTLKQLLLDR